MEDNCMTFNKTNVFVIPLLSFLSSCSVIDGGSYHTYRPSPLNSYTGLIAGELSDPPVVNMAANCSSYGGLDYSSIKSVPLPSWGVIGYVYKSYKCLGPSTPPPSNTLNQSIAPISSNNPEPFKMSLDDAKLKCVELGFPTGTERFGNCVLKLSK